MRVKLGGLIALATVAVVTGCASGGESAQTGGQASGQPVGTTTGSNLLPVLHPLSPQQVAQQLVREARVPAGALPTTTAPSRSVTGANAGQDAQPIEMHQFWRIDREWGSVYTWIEHHQAPGLTSSSSGSSSGPSLNDVEKDIELIPARVPLTVNSATLEMSVAPLGAHASAISAYAVVVKQPLRPSNENVPLTVNRAEVSLASTISLPANPPPISRRTVTGVAAETLVRYFDALTVRPPGVRSCPLDPNVVSATFRSGDQVWVASTGCGGVSVRYDGHRLPMLEDSQPFERALRAAVRPYVRVPMMTATPVR